MIHPSIKKKYLQSLSIVTGVKLKLLIIIYKVLYYLSSAYLSYVPHFSALLNYAFVNVSVIDSFSSSHKQLESNKFFVCYSALYF